MRGSQQSHRKLFTHPPMPTADNPLPLAASPPTGGTFSLTFNHRVLASLALATLLLVLAVTASFWAFRQIETATETRIRSYDLLVRAETLLSDLKDAETGQHGYSLTGDEAFLQPYLAVSAGISDKLAELDRLATAGDVRKHVTALIPLVNAKLAQMSALIELRRANGIVSANAALGSGQGKQLMDSIRAELNSFIQLEERALFQGEATLKSDLRNLFIVIVTASVLTFAFAISFALLLYRETRQRLKNLVHLETRHLLDIQESTNRQLQQANLTLQESRENLVVTLNSIGDAVIATDAAGLVMSLNPLAERLTGWTQAEAVGRPIDDIVHIINQQSRQPVINPIVNALAHGSSQSMANHTLLIARDGSECAIADSCAPIRNRDALVVGAVLVFRDVTREHELQAVMRDNTTLIQTILNTVADGIVTLRAAGGIIETVNPAVARMFGYAAEELTAQPFSLLVPELGRDQRDGSLESYSAGDEARAAGQGRAAIGRRKDGSTFPLEIAATEMWLGGKRYFTGMLRDVTVRKRFEIERNEALASAQKANLAKSDFLSSMSHELRTPLNAILGFAQLMESGTPAPTVGQKKSIDQILQAGWYLLELINEILDLALIESGKVSMSHEPVALAEVMLDCRALIEPQAQKRGIAMVFPRFETPRFVSADRTRVKQVLINLLFNAVKYNRPGGSVTVECEVRGADSIRISVRDTGAGLTAQQLTQLFQPFNRLGRGSGTEEGTGIGLVVTRQLVELMGGSIGVESTVGTGTVFWIELHLAHAPRLSAAENDPMTPAQSPLPIGTSQRTLLYVEDNPANMTLIEELIARRPDLRLLTATDGDLGIEFARVYQPSVILMDIHLPGISGIDAMRILHADPATAHIPILALSANAVPREVQKGLEAGFFDYLTKPIKVRPLMDALDAALEYAQSNRRRMARKPGKETA